MLIKKYLLTSLPLLASNLYTFVLLINLCASIYLTSSINFYYPVGADITILDAYWQPIDTSSCNGIWSCNNQICADNLMKNVSFLALQMRVNSSCQITESSVFERASDNTNYLSSTLYFIIATIILGTISLLSGLAIGYSQIPNIIYHKTGYLLTDNNQKKPLNKYKVASLILYILCYLSSKVCLINAYHEYLTYLHSGDLPPEFIQKWNTISFISTTTIISIESFITLLILLLHLG